MGKNSDDVLNVKGIFTLDYMNQYYPFDKNKIKEKMASSKFDGFNIVNGDGYRFEESKELNIEVKHKNINYTFYDINNNILVKGTLNVGRNTISIPLNAYKLNLSFQSWGDVEISSFIIIL